MWSLPAEISLAEQADVYPFLPSITREVFMSQNLPSNYSKTVSADFEDLESFISHQEVIAQYNNNVWYRTLEGSSAMSQTLEYEQA